MARLPTLAELIKDRRLIERLTTPQMAQVLEQVKQIVKEQRLSRGAEVPASPSLFAQQLSRGEWTEAKHLKILSDWLVDLAEKRRERIMVSMPPRHGKSELISYWYPLWILARNPKTKIILASYEAEFATHWGRRVRKAVLEYGPELGLELDMSSTAADRWQLTQGGGMFTTGVGGPLTGRGANVLIIDDPIKNAEEAASETIRNKLWDWFQTTAFSRLEPGGYSIIVATRWHEDDLIGRLERAMRPDESGEIPGLPWDVLRFPALAEIGDPLERELDEPLWPARFDQKQLQIIKKGFTAYHWSALYQQNPTPEEGGGVKRRWWSWSEAQPAEFDQVIQSWDLTFKDLKASDYTVGQVWGRRGAQFFLLHQVRQRMNAADVVHAIRNTSRLYPKAVAKLIEDKANGPAVIAMMNREVAGIIPVKVKQSKDARLQAVLPLIEAGNVYLPGRKREDGTFDCSTWVSEFVEEAAAFPNGTNDDQVDAMTQALSYLQPQGWRAVSRDWKEALEPVAAQNTEEALRHHFSVSFKKAIKKSDKRIREEQRGTWGRPGKSLW